MRTSDSARYPKNFLETSMRRSVFESVHRSRTGQPYHELNLLSTGPGRSSGDEATIRKYIQEQEAEDKRLDQLEMFKDK
jgi:hypothetical protein